MTDFFCDHQNTTLYPTAYMSVPVSAASLPQDGDGTANGLGATPAVSSASWDCSSSSASGANITVMGAVVSGITGAAGSALATALATAINASTSPVTTANGNISSVYLKALVWASASGSVLTVYSRIASAALNYANNSSCAMAAGSGWTTPPATAQFSGGVGGPFAYLFNVVALTAAVSASVGTTVGGYGAMPATVMGPVADGDTIHIRSKRSGSNISIPLPTSTLTVTTRSNGTFEAPLTFVADYGNKWSGDAGQLTITMDGSLTVNRTFTTPSVALLKQIWTGTRIDDDNCSWKWVITGVIQTSSYSLTIGTIYNVASSVDLLGMEFGGLTQAYVGGPANSQNNVNANYSYLFLAGTRGASLPKDGPGALFKDLVLRSQCRVSPFQTPTSATTFDFALEDCKFDFTGVTQSSTAAIINSTGVTASRARLTAKNCKWVGLTSAMNLSGFHGFSSSSSNCALFSLIDCITTNISFCGGAATGGLLGISENTSLSNMDINRSISVLSTLGTRNFVYETARKSVAWIDSAAPRTTSSTLPDGTNFSLRYAVTSEAGNVTKYRPVIFPRLGKHNSLASGDRTVTLRFLADDNLLAQLTGGPRAPKNDELWVEVSYVHTDGTLRKITSHPGILGVASLIDEGLVEDWNAVSYDFNGVSHEYTPFQIELSLPAVKTLTELSLTIFQGVQSNSVTNVLFVDPEWSLV